MHIFLSALILSTRLLETFDSIMLPKFVTLCYKMTFQYPQHANPCEDIQPGRNLSTPALFHILGISFHHHEFCPVLSYSYFVPFFVHHQAVDILQVYQLLSIKLIFYLLLQLLLVPIFSLLFPK
jgi:hypothetical protein